MDKLLGKLNIDDPLFQVAQELQEVALKDEYFVERKLYPNVDFYSGVIYRAMGIPVQMFTVLFAIGRLPGWIAHWKEMHADTGKTDLPPTANLHRLIPNARSYQSNSGRAVRQLNSRVGS